MSDSLPLIPNQFFEFGSADEPFKLRQGGSLPGVRIAYQTHGELNAEASNAVLIFHALSGSHHVYGYTPEVEGTDNRWQEEMHSGWWNAFVGPGKAIDTEKYFIICANYLGGCYGSTGPASINPATGKAWGHAFPNLSACDLVDSQIKLLDHLGISQLLACIGTSVGGLLSLNLATRYPERVRKIASVASGYKTTILNRLLLFEQILAIENDPHFNGGDYYESQGPTYGLALARMISHKTFVHLDTFERRANADRIVQQEHLQWYEVRDPYQSYMLHQGIKFVKRFDANTYLRIIDMWSRYDATVEGDAQTPKELLTRSRDAGHEFLVFSIDSDFCFYPEEQAVLVQHLEAAEVKTMHITVHSDKGHDSFLLEPELYTPHLAALLAKP